MTLLLSVGHGTASEDELLERLGPVRSLVDVRTAPGSRRHPHLGRDRLQGWLPAVGVAYRWDPRLGGFRRPALAAPADALGARHARRAGLRRARTGHPAVA